MSKDNSTGVRDFVIPIILLVGVLVAFVFGLPLLSGMSGVTSNMSVALSSVGTEVSSAFPFIVVIIILGIAVKLKN